MISLTIVAVQNESERGFLFFYFFICLFVFVVVFPRLSPLHCRLLLPFFSLSLFFLPSTFIYIIFYYFFLCCDRAARFDISTVALIRIDLRLVYRGISEISVEIYCSDLGCAGQGN